MNRKELIKAAKEEGYADASPSKESIKKYLTDNGITFKDADGAVDVDEAWDTMAEVVVKNGEQPARKDNTDAAKKAFGAVAKVVEEGESKSAPQRFAIGSVQKAMFKAKIARGETVVKDADLAEVIGSCFRTNYMKTRGIDSWEGKDRDIEATKGLNTYTNENGGFLVPPAELMNELIYNGEPTGVARKIANVVRLGNGSNTYARETADVTLPVLAEGGTLQSITPAIDRVTPIVRKTGGYFESTMEEMEDSNFNIGDIITRKTQIAYDNRIDDDYILGDGTSTYNQFTGLANSANVTAVAASGNAWSAVTASDFNKCLGTVQGAGSNLMGICSRQFAFQVLANLEIATSQFKTVFRMNPDQMGGVFNESLPIVFSQRMPIASASGQKCMYIGNFKAGSMVGERRDLTIKPDDRTGLATDSFRWYITARYSVLIHGHGRTDLTNQNIVALRTT